MSRSARGFTLVELLVVISIIAILAVVGVTVFSGVQKSARDGRRRSDVKAMILALETHFNNIDGENCANLGGAYCPIQDNWFSSGKVPVDPSGWVYCIAFNTLAPAPLTPAIPVADWSASSCGTGNSYTPVVANSTPWGNAQNNVQICALLDSKISVYCLKASR